MTHAHLLYAMVLIASLVAAVTDVRRGLIPNWLTFPLLLAAPLLHGVRAGMSGVMLSLLGLLICGSVPLLFHRLGAMGGGDVKFIGALGLWLPVNAIIPLLIIMSLAGGVLTIAMLVRHRLAKHEHQLEIPYGVAIAVSGVWLIGEQFLNQFA